MFSIYIEGTYLLVYKYELDDKYVKYTQFIWNNSHRLKLLKEVKFNSKCVKIIKPWSKWFHLWNSI